MSTTQTKLLLSVLVLCCFGLNGRAWAEPTTVPGDKDGTGAETTMMGRDAVPQKGLGIGGDTAVNVPNQPNTIQMLLELQATPESAASASESGRRAVRPGAGRTGAPAPAPNPFGNGENPFGASPSAVRAAPSAASQPAAIEWQAGMAGGALGGNLGAGAVSAHNPDLFPAQSPRGSSRDDVADQRWWMPMALIRWVREHRQAVLIGAAVALGLAWATTSYSQRRR